MKSEMDYYPEDQKLAITQFLEIYTYFGLQDFSKYKGKITQSWKPNTAGYEYAKYYRLWHYHLGIPKYEKSRYHTYYTSDYVLHFIWDKPNHITLVDVTPHYNAKGEFILPTKDYLE
ncbi:hypothetical protein [Lonepinella sp. BR2271]|uniref:hypothetical protein n=1 Tax=Lonepinella sp. BR2271 TaxID=3434550 RepID=UPI003F6DD736